MSRPVLQSSAGSFNSSKSTQAVSLSRRLLFPHLPPEVALPPLLISSFATPELNAELYDFIAFALRAFVNPWWTKITRYDKQFLSDITRITTIVVRNIENRVLAADLSSLLLRDIPTLVTQHYRDYRNAESKLSTSYATGAAVSLPQLFHQFQPHIAVSPDGTVHEEYVRLIIDHILKTSLPSEDYEPEAERFVVREIVIKVILQDVIPLVAQPWFINHMILDLIGPSDPVQLPNQPKPPPTAAHTVSHSSFSFHNLLIIIFSALQSISGIGLALAHSYKQAVSTIKLVNSQPSPSARHAPQTAAAPLITSNTPAQDKNVAEPLLIMLSEIFKTNSRFSSSSIMMAVAMSCAAFTPFFDRLLPQLLAQKLSPSFLASLIASAKHNLFQQNYRPSSPSPEEQASTRERLVSWRSSGILGHYVANLVLGTEGHERWHRRTLEGALDPLGNRECNVHLLVLLMDRIVLALWPELAVREEPPKSAEEEDSFDGDFEGTGIFDESSREVSITPPGSFK